MFCSILSLSSLSGMLFISVRLYGCMLYIFFYVLHHFVSQWFIPVIYTDLSYNLLIIFISYIQSAIKPIHWELSSQLSYYIGQLWNFHLAFLFFPSLPFLFYTFQFFDNIFNLVFYLLEYSKHAYFIICPFLTQISGAPVGIFLLSIFSAGFWSRCCISHFQVFLIMCRTLYLL